MIQIYNCFWYKWNCEHYFDLEEHNFLLDCLNGINYFLLHINGMKQYS